MKLKKFELIRTCKIFNSDNFSKVDNGFILKLVNEKKLYVIFKYQGLVINHVFKFVLKLH